MSDLPKREDVEGSVRRNFNASLMEQLVGLETDKALLMEELNRARAQNAQLAGVVKALQGELAKYRPAADDGTPVTVAVRKGRRPAPPAAAAE